MISYLFNLYFSFLINNWLLLASLWAVTITAFLYYILYVKLEYTLHLDPNIKEEHKPFQRTDRKNWGFVKTVIGGFFLIPIRLPMAIFSMVFA